MDAGHRGTRPRRSSSSRTGGRAEPLGTPGHPPESRDPCARCSRADRKSRSPSSSSRRSRSTSIAVLAADPAVAVPELLQVGRHHRSDLRRRRQLRADVHPRRRLLERVAQLLRSTSPSACSSSSAVALFVANLLTYVAARSRGRQDAAPAARDHLDGGDRVPLPADLLVRSRSA